MIEHIPLIADFENGTMIVPALRINTGVVNDGATTLIGASQALADSIVQAGWCAPRLG